MSSAARARRSACAARSSAFAISHAWEISRTRISRLGVKLWQILLVVALGVAFGLIEPGRLTYAFGHATLYVFLPALLFEAGWNLDYRAILRHWMRDCDAGRPRRARYGGDRRRIACDRARAVWARVAFRSYSQCDRSHCGRGGLSTIESSAGARDHCRMRIAFQRCRRRHALSRRAGRHSHSEPPVRRDCVGCARNVGGVPLVASSLERLLAFVVARASTQQPRRQASNSRLRFSARTARISRPTGFGFPASLRRSHAASPCDITSGLGLRRPSPTT